MTMASQDLWVFGYGSLMWRPGFAYEESQRALLVGYRRCFCVFTVHHRGTPERPGLVLGLDRGGTCEGIAYRVAAKNAAATVAYLRAREQVKGVYREIHVPIQIGQSPGREVLALTYVAERAHPNFAGKLPLRTQAALIKAGKGLSGVNLDYLISTLRHLRDLGIRERELERILTVIGPHFARCPLPPGVPSPFAAAVARSARMQPPAIRRLVAQDQRRHFLYRQRIGSPVGQDA
jgi:cation transport protein ChaC